MVAPPVAGKASRSARIVVAVLAVAALLRFVGLAMFPEINADEGLWTNSSKNFLLFGDWFMDGRTHLFLSPLFHGLSVLVFKMTGPSIGAARIISAIAGTASVWLVYAVVARATREPQIALLAAVIFGFSQWSVLESRQALIEPLELSLSLVAVLLVLRGELWAAAAAGGALGLALLAKTNAGFLVPVLGGYALLGRPETAGRLSTPRRLLYALVLVATAVALAASVYASLYLAHPDAFVRAFRFELDGVHFESFSHPLLRVGRFGIDPVQEGRTIIALVREAPFLIVLAALGLGVWWVRRPAGSSLFALWLAVGMPFFLCQMYQPLRYFYLISPALAFSAALAAAELGGVTGRQSAHSRPLLGVVVAIYIAFNLSYLGMSAVANRGKLLRTVIGWAAEHIKPSDSVVAAGYFCTDLPNRAYAFYHLAESRDGRSYSPDRLLESIRQYKIRYLIVDNGEWPPALQEAVRRRFTAVQRWDFGAVYQVDAPPVPGGP